MDESGQKGEQARIDRLKKGLYKKDKEFNHEYDTKLKPQKFNVSEDWEEDEVIEERRKNQKVKKTKVKKNMFFRGLLIFSVMFFLMSFGVAFYVFYGGINIVSTENVDLSIVGPSVIGGGEELSFQITVQNNNSVDLVLADLIVDFPKGTLSSDQNFKELTQIRKELGVVSAGGSATKSFKGILFGSEGDKKDLIVTVEYRAEDSNAIFFKDRKYELMIDSSPIGFVLDLPNDVMTGQEFEFSVDIISNSTEIIEDLLFTVDYPFGFEFKGSNIEPVYKNNVWDFGDVKPDSEMTLKVRGILIGQDGEERVFNFHGGIQSEDDENEIKAALVSSSESIFLKKTLFGLDLVLDGDYSPEHFSQTGEPIRGDILWSNNLLTRLSDVKVVVSLNGVVLDKSSVSSVNGYYKSSSNTITWDKENSSQLELLGPTTSGSLSFSFAPYSLAAVSNMGIKNPEINIDITATGNKLSDETVEKISTTISKKVKVKTDLLLTARSLYSVGSFKNTGPIPPQVDKETTYTVVLTATNTSNDVENAKVRASLPSYVRWLGVSSPYSENISFNQVGGEVVWNVGTIEAGKGISSSSREVSFQVVLLPSLSQLNLEPVLLKNISIEGQDDFTDTSIKYSVKDLSTRISTDPIYHVGNGEVSK